MSFLRNAVLTVVVLLVGAGFTTVSGGERLPWQSDLAVAQELSVKHGRPLLVFVMTKNCVYCRKMEQNTWANEAMHERLQTEFIPLRLDADKHPELAAKFGVEGFPATLIYGSNRRLLGQFVGYAPLDLVLQMLDQLLPSGRANQQQ
jgi:thioredoxin-related protein